jgi:hypothetical protein
MILRALICWMLHAGHDYGDWRRKGSKGGFMPYRICRRCSWVQMPERSDDP